MHTWNTTCRFATELVVFVLALGSLPSFLVLAQVQPSMPPDVAGALSRVAQGKIAALDLDQIARAGAVQAIPVLRSRFAQEHDMRTKALVASALVRLGDKDSTYWGFLADQAKEAIQDDAPFPSRFDSEGRLVKRQFSPEFLEWAEARNQSANNAAEERLYEFPGRVLLLGEAGDSRSVPLLRQALSSQNYLIQAVAAKGLAKLQDKESIPLIAAACHAAPRGASRAIAKALVFFSDSDAQAEAENYLPKDEVHELRRLSKIPGNDAFYH